MVDNKYNGRSGEGEILLVLVGFYKPWYLS